MLRILRHSRKTVEGLCRPGVKASPGCLALFRVVQSRVFNHGGIITAWPTIIHAADGRVRESDATKYRMTGFHEMAIFDPWVKNE